MRSHYLVRARKIIPICLVFFFLFFLNETGLFTTTKIEDRYDTFVEQELAWLPVFVK